MYLACENWRPLEKEINWRNRRNGLEVKGGIEARHLRVGVLGDGGSVDKDSWTTIDCKLPKLQSEEGESSITHGALLAIHDGGDIYVGFDNKHLGGGWAGFARAEVRVRARELVLRELVVGCLALWKPDCMCASVGGRSTKLGATGDTGRLRLKLHKRMIVVASDGGRVSKV